jgi:hypothetical protein
MAYQTGVSGSVNDLVTALLAFAGANGFTASTAWTSGADSLVTLTKNSIFFVFQYNSTLLSLNTATAVSGSGAATAQTGAAAVSMQVNQIAGPHISYHFFCDGEACHAAVEIATNVFSHINFGFVTKNGSWTGGAFVTGSTTTPTAGAVERQLLSGYNLLPFHTLTRVNDVNTPSSSKPHIRTDIANVNGVSGMAVGFSGASSTVFNKAWLVDGGGRPLLTASPNAFNGRSVIAPITLIQSTSGIDGPYYQMGHVPNAGVINIATIEPKADVNTDWMVFPIGQKGTSGTGHINSGNYAMAYKK